MTARGGSIRKRSVTIAGHPTSVSLEAPFWEALGRIAEERGMSVPSLVAAVDAGRGGANLSSAIRVFVLNAVTASIGRNDSPSRRSPDAS